MATKYELYKTMSAYDAELCQLLRNSGVEPHRENLSVNTALIKLLLVIPDHESQLGHIHKYPELQDARDFIGSNTFLSQKSGFVYKGKKPQPDMAVEALNAFGQAQIGQDIASIEMLPTVEDWEFQEKQRLEKLI